MTSEQYRALLAELARLGGLKDPSALLDEGRVKVGEWSVQLLHEPEYDAGVVQVRMFPGSIPPEQGHGLTRALLEANYVNGYGGECVFSLLPASRHVVIGLRLRLHPALSAQELWQELSDIVRHGGRLWDEARAVHAPQAFHPAQLERV